MKVLNSSTAFREHYSRRIGLDISSAGESLAKGGAVGAGVAGSAALAVGHAAAASSAWSIGSGLPLVGGFFAGKATAVGIAAGTAAVGSAAVLLPALAIGGIVAYKVYRNRDKRPIQKTTSATRLANAFARVACLPMLACAVALCQANRANANPVQEYLVREMGAWGYSEEYVRAGFDKAMKHSPEEINGAYDWMVGQLRSGSDAGLGATPGELPPEAICAFAEEFKENFASNLQ